MTFRSDSDDQPTFTGSDIEHLIALLTRDDVRRAVLVATSSSLEIEDLVSLPLPSGMTREQTVDLVTAVSRIGAIYSPIPDREGRLHWYVCTGRIRHALSEIDRYCTVDSQLYEATISRSGARFLVQANVEEALATAQLDGVKIDYEAAKELLLMRRQPRTVEERLIVNQFRLTERLPEMVDRPWTPETMFELYALLTQGLPTDASKPPTDDWPQREAVLRGLCDYADHPTRDMCEHPAITASIIRAVVGYWETFPGWNGMMSRILLRFYALKQGYPILGYIPISRTELDLARHRSGAESETMKYSDILDKFHESNATVWLSAHVTLMTHALRHFRSRMQRAAVIDQAVLNELQTDTSLNHRQRSIIGRALRVPDATFRIAYHRTTHGIGYATAYRDFAALVEQGYLVEELQGRLKVFRAGPRLEQRMGALQDIGRIEDFEVPLPQELLGDPTPWRDA